VTPDDSQTYVAGREWMFGALPKTGEPFDKYYGSATTAAAMARM
jgi:hypothetical protein